jgi:parallel beta-helix repeat protein
MKRRTSVGAWALFVASLFVLSSCSQIGGNQIGNEKSSGEGEPAPLSLPVEIGKNYVPHAPIHINSNTEFATVAAGEGWAGDGSQGSPYIIENYEINGTGYGQYCVYIGNTTDYFEVRSCNLHGAGLPISTYRFSGLMLYNVQNGSISNNIVWNNTQHGMKLDYSSNNVITNNNFSSNDNNGIYMVSSSNNNIIKNNSAKWNPGSGVSVFGSYNNNITDNNASSDFAYGIFIGTSSSGNTIFNNTASNNLVGIFINLCSGNIIYHNNIITNNVQASDSEINSWNVTYPTGGNYWSNYTGIDAMSGPLQNLPGPDGIGDTPFIIDTDSRDYYPLMKPLVNDRVQRPPIRINSNSEFDAAHGVSAGNGSQSNPYIIENYDINGTGYGYCIYVGNTTNYFRVQNCYLHEASGVWNPLYYLNSGLILHNVQNGDIANNNASSNNNDGIHLYFSHKNTISSNTASLNGGVGIILDVENNFNSVINNTVSNNEVGISFAGESSIIASNIIFSNLLTGIEDDVSSDTYTIANNTVSNNRFGIRLNSLDEDITIVNNNISSNSQIGIYVFSYTAKIYNNNIISNALQALEMGPVLNLWNATYPIGGNYWSDYTGIDLKSGPLQDQPGGDGFGDTPYVIDVDSQDYYPLMTPWSSGLFQRPPIRINSNSEFDAAHGVTDGSGTDIAPWIIENYDINGSSYGYCIYVGNTTDYFTVQNCYLHHANDVGSNPYFCDSGMILYNVQNGIVVDNTISSNRVSGVYLESSAFNVFDGNAVSSNMYGYNLYSSTINSMNHDDLFLNSYGVWLYFSDGNKVACCNISSSGSEGIWIGWSNSNSIAENNIADNPYGVTLEASLNNNIRHNNFFNCPNPPSGATGNIWDEGYPSGGNYWSDYVGIDICFGSNQSMPGSDGIGDTPYALNGETNDNYPLMSPYDYMEHEFPLQQGWNLISLPVRQLTEPIDSVLDSLADKWDFTQAYNSSNPTSPWESNATFKPASLNDLDSMNHLKGYWLHITEPNITLTVKGDKFDSALSIPLKAGWNLVGYPSLSQRAVSVALAGTGYDGIEGFNATDPYRTSYLPGSYMMKPGEGYWVHLPADSVWVVDW